MDASSMINKLAPVLTHDEVYNELRLDAETKRNLKAAFDATGHLQSYHSMSFIIDSASYSTTCEIHMLLPQRWNLPTIYLTPTSAFTQIVKLAQKWSIVNYIFEETVLYMSRDALSGVFPWIRSVIMEENYDFVKERETKWGKVKPDNLDFFHKYSIKQVANRHRVDMCMRAAMRNPKNIPILPAAMREGAMLGNELWTQFRLLKDHPYVQTPPSGMTKVIPRVSEGLVPERFKEAVEQMKALRKGFEKAARFDNE
jgi:hypothetical protein